MLADVNKLFVFKSLLTNLPQANFPTHNLNFHCRWRWWDWIQAIFLHLFYFKFLKIIWNSPWIENESAIWYRVWLQRMCKVSMKYLWSTICYIHEFNWIYMPSCLSWLVAVPIQISKRRRWKKSRESISDFNVVHTLHLQCHCLYRQL